MQAVRELELVLVSSLLLNKCRMCQGGLSVGWHVKFLAVFGKWYGLFGGDLSCESRELRPASAFLARLLCYCCFCSLCISFIKKKAFSSMHCHRLCIVADYALSWTVYCHRVCPMHLCLAVTRLCCELSKIPEIFNCQNLL